jgi:hypothetical protein
VTGSGSDPAAYPTFAGDGSGTWLRYRGAEGAGHRPDLRGLRIARYATAITLNGNRNDPAAFNVVPCWKDRQRHDERGQAVHRRDPPGQRAGHGGARVSFSPSATPRATSAGLHAIYLASHATGARIEGNTFQDFCGSAIKLRDASGGATITGNHFRDADGAGDRGMVLRHGAHRRMHQGGGRMPHGIIVTATISATCRQTAA